MKKIPLPPVVIVVDLVSSGPAKVPGSIRGACSRCERQVWLSVEDLRRTTRKSSPLPPVCERCHGELQSAYRHERDIEMGAKA